MTSQEKTHLIALHAALQRLAGAHYAIETAYRGADNDNICLDDLPCVNISKCLAASADEMHFPISEAIERIEAALKAEGVTLV